MGVAVYSNGLYLLRIGYGHGGTSDSGFPPGSQSGHSGLRFINPEIRRKVRSSCTPSESGDRTHAQLLLQQHFDWGGPMVREAIGAIAQLALSACAPTVEDAAGGSAAGEAVDSEGGATSAQRSE